MQQTDWKRKYHWFPELAEKFGSHEQPQSLHEEWQACLLLICFHLLGNTGHVTQTSVTFLVF